MGTSGDGHPERWISSCVVCSVWMSRQVLEHIWPMSDVHETDEAWKIDVEGLGSFEVSWVSMLIVVRMKRSCERGEHDE